MNDWEQNWKRLVSLSREAQEVPASNAAPYGFATRVIAQWQQLPERFSILRLWERFAMGAVALSAVVLTVIYLMPEPSTDVDPGYEYTLASSDIENLIQP